jgi:hypothetical protein
MSYYEDVLKTLAAAQSRDLRSENKRLEGTPPVRLRRTRDHGRQVLLHEYYEDGARVRKVVRDPVLLEALLRKEYLLAKTAASAGRLDALKDSIARVKELRTDDEILDGILARLRLPADAKLRERIIYPQSRKADKWAREPYRMSDYKPGNRVHKARGGLMVRSKSEVIIIELFHKYGVRFHYEEVFIAGGKHYAPDFTIMRADGSLVYWEHLGMLNDRAYFEGQLEKLRDYYARGLILGQNLIISFDNGDGVIDVAEIEHLIRTRVLRV